MYSHSPNPDLVTGEKLLAFLEHNKGREVKNKPGHVIGIETFYSGSLYFSSKIQDSFSKSYSIEVYLKEKQSNECK